MSPDSTASLVLVHVISVSAYTRSHMALSVQTPSLKPPPGTAFRVSSTLLASCQTIIIGRLCTSIIGRLAQMITSSLPSAYITDCLFYFRRPCPILIPNITDCFFYFALYIALFRRPCPQFILSPCCPLHDAPYILLFWETLCSLHDAPYCFYFESLLPST